MLNEKGSSLLTVLGIVVVFFILGISLSSMTLATRIQNNKTDNVNSSTDIAEMGITHYQTIVEGIVKSANDYAIAGTTTYYNNANNNNKPTETQLESKYRQLFCEKVTTSQPTQLNYKLSQTINVERNAKYDVTVQKFVGNCSSENNVKINFISQGFDNKQSKTVNGVVTISKLDISSSRLTPNAPIPEKSNYTIYSLPVNLTGNNKLDPFPSPTWFEKTVLIKGNKKPLNVKGNVFFQELVSTNGNIMLTIEGDVIFNKGLSVNGNPKNMCITGKTYTVNSNKQLVPYDISSYNKCYNPSGDLLSKFAWTTTQIPLSVSY